MLRPERMSKVSVTGSKGVMEQVVETTHELNLLHVADYDGSFEGFEVGDPMDGADDAADKLVTVRSIESILDVDAEEAGPTRIVTDEALEEELADVRERVNELDDRRTELEDELRAVEEERETTAPFVDLGIDLDLLSGYDSLQTAVGVGDADEIRRALAATADVREHAVFAGDEAVAAFAYPAEDADADALSEALVGATFTAVEVPDADGDPADRVQELDRRVQQLESELETVESQLDDVKTDFAGFLLAAEEKLTIDVQKREAPLSFATTDNAFVAEGWIPTERFGEFVAALDDAVGNHVEVEELERAQYTSNGKRHSEPVGEAPPGGEPNVATDGGAAIAADDPPVVQSNPGLVKPFQVLTNAVSKPSYAEFDPTAVLFLTFPVFFGFMIGDLGYGLLYTAIGYYLYDNFDSEGVKSMGGVTIAAGVSTALFGVLYGEVFGLHLISTYLWEGAVGLKAAPLHKGLQPAEVSWALGWLVVSMLAGIVHLNVGWVLDFVEGYQLHDLKHAVFESGSWLLMLNGIWVWIFARPQGPKPGFLYTLFDGTHAPPSGEGEFLHAIVELGFNGFAPVFGTVGLAAFFVGLVLLAVGEPAELPEFLNVVVNVLSYTRIAAVLLAKAGMAFTVNLLFFGAYVEEGEFHFLLNKGPEAVEHGEILFNGLIHGGAAMVLVGLLVLLLGHLLVLALGVTSAGLQAVRLEYVEFFQKFYEGGGTEYEPFGHEREFTTQD
ncbi:MAG: V-type ATP synthase subunit I [Halolamina sp.]